MWIVDPVYSDLYSMFTSKELQLQRNQPNDSFIDGVVVERFGKIKGNWEFFACFSGIIDNYFVGDLCS